MICSRQRLPVNTQHEQRATLNVFADERVFHDGLPVRLEHTLELADVVVLVCPTVCMHYAYIIDY